MKLLIIIILLILILLLVLALIVVFAIIYKNNKILNDQEELQTFLDKIRNKDSDYRIVKANGLYAIQNSKTKYYIDLDNGSEFNLKVDRSFGDLKTVIYFYNRLNPTIL